MNLVSLFNFVPSLRSVKPGALITAFTFLIWEVSNNHTFKSNIAKFGNFDRSINSPNLKDPPEKAKAGPDQYCIKIEIDAFVTRFRLIAGTLQKIRLDQISWELDQRAAINIRGSLITVL